MFGFSSPNTSSLMNFVLGVTGQKMAAREQQSYNVTNMALQNRYNKEEMKYANELNKDLADYNQRLTLNNLMTTPYALRQGMETAGFNPILAYSSGNFSNASSAGSSPALGSSLPNSPKLDYGSVVSNAFNNGLAVQQQLNANRANIAQVNNTNADTILKASLVDTEKSRQRLNFTQSKLNLINKELVQKDIDNYERKLLIQEKRNILQEELNTSYKEQASAAVQNSITNAGQLNVEKDIRREQVQQQREYNEWAKKHPYLKSIDQTLTRYFNGFGANIGASKRLK